jgi:hypothetical protein
MPSAIESAAYGELADHVSPDGHVGEHCIVEFTMRRNPPADCSDVVVLGVVPEQREYSSPTVLTFHNAHVGRIVQHNYDPEFNFLPWSIVGFHCTELGDAKWSFQLNCESLRIEWSSDWPSIVRGG